MEKKFMFTPNSILQMEVDTSKRVAIMLPKGKTGAIDLQLPVERPYARLLGNWIVECKNQTILLRQNRTAATEDGLSISFEEEHVKIHAKMITDAGARTETFDISGEISITNDTIVSASGTKEAAKETREEEPVKKESFKKEPSKEEPSKKETRKESGTDSGELEALRHELELEKLRSKQLQHVLEARMDDFVKLAREASEKLSEEEEEKLRLCEEMIGEKAKQTAKLEDLDEKRKRMEDELVSREKEIVAKEDELADLEESIQEKKKNLEDIFKKIEELKAQGEVTELDCDKAKDELEEIKTRINLDQETIDLLESSNYRLKRGTVSKTMAEIEKEIEKVEKRIGLFLKIREKFNKTVEEAIFARDGVISEAEEAGGNENGD